MDFVKFQSPMHALFVSKFALGTAALGNDYAGARVTEPKALIDAALARKITLFDTAPTYGRAETLLGTLLAGDPNATQIVTKTSVQSARNAATAALSELRIGRAPAAVLLHNPSVQELKAGALNLLHDIWMPETKIFGASVYTVEEAHVAIEEGAHVVQVPFNFFNQDHLDTFIEAKKAGVGVMIRSVLLRGAFTDRIHSIECPQHIRAHTLFLLRDRFQNIPDMLRVAAIRFAAAACPEASVILGATKPAELSVLDHMNGLCDADVSPFYRYRLRAPERDPRVW